MKISRDNYEIWFIDYLDGKLTVEQTAVLMAFLQENPDLEEELNSVSEVKLNPESIPFNAKASLKKYSSDTITPHNIDQYIVRHIDMELNPSEIDEMYAYLKRNPEKNKDLALFQRTRVQPDLTISFPDKNSLKRHSVAEKTHLNIRRAIAIAASVIIILTISLAIFRNKTERSSFQAEFNKKTNNLQRPVKQIAPSQEQQKLQYTPFHQANQAIPEEQNNYANIYPQPQNISLPDSNPVIKNIIRNDPEPYYAYNTTQTDSSYNAIFTQNKYTHFREMVENVPYDAMAFNSAEPVTLWDVAEIGSKGLSTISGEKINLNRQKDENGNVKKVSFSAGFLKISKTFRKK